MATEAIKKIVQEQAAKTFQVEVPDFEIEYPEEKFGDYSSNIAFKLAKPLSKSPLDIAQQLAGDINGADIQSVDTVAPGFINFTMSPEYWLKQLVGIAEGKEAKVPKAEQIQVEFISANPTGPLTLANARGGYLGDVLANVLSVVGHKVTREYYLNDSGGQIEQLARSIRVEAGQKIDGERQYTGDYIKDLSNNLKSKLDGDDKELGKAAVREVVELLKQTIAEMGIKFDVWFSEQSLIDSGLTQKVIDEFRKQGLIYEEDGATWLKSSQFGDNRDRVLVKSSGEYVYLVNDYAYHYNIFVERKIDKAIKIWGADHAGQVESLRLGVLELMPKAQLDFILLQMVRIIKDGKEFKSSKRAGNFITVSDLLEEVGSSDVVRFFFLMHSAESQMDFDIDLAQETSQKNPLYYAMYSYARANSILAKAAEKNIVPSTTMQKLNPIEIALIRQMSRFHEILLQIAQSYEVQRLSFYGLETARIFHSYYESEKFIDLEPTESANKLHLLDIYRKFMEDYFDILGITPQKRMDRENT